MRVFFCLSFIILFSSSIAAQSDTYERFKKMVIDEGWIFSDDKKMHLKQGETDYGIYKLQPGKEYKIYCMSDDGDVTDGDIWVYNYETKELMGKDVDNARMGIVNITDGKETIVQVIGKNITSKTPGYQSRFYILVVYKPVKYVEPSRYYFSTMKKAVDFMNGQIMFAYINTGLSIYEFKVLGKTDFDKKSFEFIEKSGKLYLKMHIPRNGNCDYGLKEVLAEFTGESGKGSSGGKEQFYFKFKYTYTCESKIYNGLYVYLNRIPDADIEKLKKKIASN